MSRRTQIFPVGAATTTFASAKADPVSLRRISFNMQPLAKRTRKGNNGFVFEGVEGVREHRDVTLLSQSMQKAQAGAIVPEGNGSGIVWESENSIVTNYHAVSSATRGS